MIISSSFKKLSLERKEEIRDFAININNIINDYRMHSRYGMNLYQKLSKSYSLFQKYYRSNLTEEEKSVFYLYITFPNDICFEEMINKNKCDFKKISEICLVPENVVKMRYFLQKLIAKEKEEIISKKKTIC